jgi:molybdopterin-synthase adenylyltransferase
VSAPVKPRLKDVAWERDGDELRLVRDIREQLLLTDPDGAVESLLALLREGGRTLAELAEVLSAHGAEVSVSDVTAAVELLDSYRLLTDDERMGEFAPVEGERYASNLAFLESFSTLSRSHEELQQALRDSHVLVLGTGGFGCSTIPHLAGLGIGRLTLVDQDAVELRNFARQFLYRRTDIGARKVALAADWVRAFAPEIEVTALDLSITEPEQVDELLDRAAPDLLVLAIDSPPGATGWVNAACLSRGIPYVAGGVSMTHGAVWSVQPGSSACFACAQMLPDGDAGERAARALYTTMPQVNRAIGPAVGLLGALCAWEVLRYLTRFEQPSYSGRPLVIDFADGCATRPEPWLARPDCPECARARQPGTPPAVHVQRGGR